MSGAPPGGHLAEPDLAASFLDRRQILVPLLDVQEDLIRRLLSRHTHSIGRFLDVGSGDGAMTELVLSSQPESEAVLVDFSDPMLERAGSASAGLARPLADRPRRPLRIRRLASRAARRRL